VADILTMDNEIDILTTTGIYQQLTKEEEISLEQQKMNIAEAVKAGMAATQSKTGVAWYQRWWNRCKRKIRKLSGLETHTVWDTMGSKSSRL